MNCHSPANQYATAETQLQHYFIAPFLPTDRSHVCYGIWLRDPETGLLLHCCHLCAFAFRTTVLEILKHKCILDSSKATPAGSCFDSQIHSRELRSPCRSLNACLHHRVMCNTRSLIAHFLEAVCVRT